VLVDKDNSNVLAFLGEAVKGLFDGVSLGLVVDDEVVLLSIRRVGNMLYSEVRGLSRIERIQKMDILRRQQARLRSPSPVDWWASAEQHEKRGSIDYLVADNSKELTVLVSGLGKSHYVLFLSDTRNVAVTVGVCGSCD
jgi:hypothetical protein